MPFDILLLIDQIRKFLKSEKGTIVSLLAIIFIELIIYNFLYNLLIKYVPTLEFLKIFELVMLLTVVLWWLSRRIPTSKTKTNIGISRFDIINIDIRNTLTGEARFNLAEELDLYIYNRLLLDNRRLDLRKYLNIVVLPPRFAIDRNNKYNFRKFRFLDFVVTGVVYFENEKLYITPNFIFVYDLPTLLFKQIKDKLITDKKILFNLDGSANLEFDKLLHGMTYIGFLYTCVKQAHRRQFEKADEFADEIIDNLKKLYDSDDQSVNHGDINFLKIEALLYFIKAKNLHKYGNHLLFDKSDVEGAKKMYHEAATTLLHRIEVLKKLKELHNETVDDEIVDHSYVYAIGLLAKEKNREQGGELLASLNQNVKNESNAMLAEALYAERMNEPDQALPKYQKIVEKNPKNVYALRRLVSIYFLKGRYKECISSGKQLRVLTHRQVYDVEFYDTRVIFRICLSDLFTFRLPDAAIMFCHGLYAVAYNKVQSLKGTTF